MPIKAILVDDEKNNLENLKFLLENDCRDVEIAGLFQSGKEARRWLETNNTDVLFLDINMPNETGFEMLEKIPVKNFSVVFVTAYNEFAIQAIKASAVDYLLKPVDIAELQKTVEKLNHSVKDQSISTQGLQLMENLIQNYATNRYLKKIALPHLGGISFLDTEEVISLEADGNYTIIHKKNMQKLIVTKTLKDFEEILDSNQFVRIHKSYMVNLKLVTEYSTVDGGTVKMQDGNSWNVSRRQSDLFLQKLKNFNVLFFNT
jgi:two-component system LytT family response regulator